MCACAYVRTCECACVRACVCVQRERVLYLVVAQKSLKRGPKKKNDLSAEQLQALIEELIMLEHYGVDTIVGEVDFREVPEVEDDDVSHLTIVWK